MKDSKRMFEIHDEYIKLIKDTAFDKSKEKHFFNITKQKYIEEEKIINSIKCISAGLSSIKNHLKRRKKIDYDWEYDINQDIEDLKTEVESWLKN